MNRAEEVPAVHVDVRFLKGVLPADVGRIPVLIRLQAVAGHGDRRRTPVDLALVLDRSGSMKGEPLAAAIRAAHDAIDLLEPGDRVAIVTFGSEADVVVPLRQVDDRGPIHTAIDGIAVDGMTALHAGWLEGATQVVEVLDPARAARVVLLTDGLANRGVTNRPRIVRDVREMCGHGVATSSIGLGRAFEEDLLSAIADGGSGRFSFAETVDDLEGLMAAELIAVDATVARSVRVTFPHGGGRARAVSVLNDLQVDDGALALPDLIEGLPLDVVLLVEVEPGAAAEAVDLGAFDVRFVGTDGGTRSVLHRVAADFADRRGYEARPDDPDVAVAFAVLSAARLRQRAMAALDREDDLGARRELDEIEKLLAPLADAPAVVRERRAVMRVRAALDAHDAVLARKRMSVDRDVGRKSFDRAAFAETPHFRTKEEALTHRRAAREAPPVEAPAQRPGPTSHVPSLRRELEVVRSDGSVGNLILRLGDLTEVAADAIVNPTNPRLHGTGVTVDGAVHRRGGMELTRECRAIGQVDYGQTVVTKGWNLPATYVLHTAVVAFDGGPKSKALLASCYESSLALARQLRLTHLAYPAIGAGMGQYPPNVAAQIALPELLRELEAVGGVRRIEVVLDAPSMFRAYERVLARVRRGSERT